jgi:hypothetical protein
LVQDGVLSSVGEATSAFSLSRDEGGTGRTGKHVITFSDHFAF